jgi:ribosomal protein S18 acetylase RimI-like enzyme
MGASHRSLRSPQYDMPQETIRYAIPDDAAALSALATRTFHDTYAAFNTPENMAAHLAATFTPDRQRIEIETPGTFIVLAQHEQALIAYAHVVSTIVPPPVGDAHALEIKRFYVDRAWHGCGVAQRLMTKTIASAAERGAATVWLTVWDQNPRAIAFYRKVGFRDVGLYPFRLGTDVQTDLLMIRETAQ